MNTRKAYRMIVLIVCLLSLALSMLACDGGGDSCVNGAGEYIPCSTEYNVYNDSDSVTNQVKQAVQQVNNSMSDDATWWVNQHSGGEWSRDCLSVWSETCEQAGAYSK